MATGDRLPYTMRPVKYMTMAETEAFFRSIPREHLRNRLMFDLIYRHGLRRTEAVLLRVGNVQGDRIWIGRVKNGISGEYPLHPSTKKLLAAYLTDETPEDAFLLQSRQSKGTQAISASTMTFLN